LVLDADYTIIDGKPAVRLYCKSSNGKSVLVIDKNFKPYFYIMPKDGKVNELRKKVEKLDVKKFEARVVSSDVVERVWQGEPRKIVKITIDNPRSIFDVRDVVKNWKDVEGTYEYDIPFYKRYIMDKQIEPTAWIEVSGEDVKEKGDYQVDRMVEADSVKAVDERKEINIKVLAFDTEFVEEDEKEKLIMLSVAGSDGYKKVLTSHHWDKKPAYVEAVKGERKIIERFLEIVEERDADFVVGYNSDGFDFPMLKERATEAKISLKMGRDNQPIKIVQRGRISSAKSKGRVHIDLFNFIGHVLSASMRSEVMSLDEVAQELLGVGKKKMNHKEMKEMWGRKEQMGRLAEYSMWDSELTVRLAGHILPQIFALAKLTGTLPFDCSRYSYSQLVETFFMRHAVTENVLIPNRPKTDEIERRRETPIYKGAIVIEPRKGIHSDILVFDFRSLYPSIIVTHNISPETLDCRHKKCLEKNRVPESNSCFCTEKRGFIPKHLEFLIETRKKIKEKMKRLKEGTEEWKQVDNEQYALKIIANATYGYFGYFGSKWYCRECGSAAASFGRFYINKILEEAKQFGFEIIYGDTDSLFVVLRDSSPKKEKIIKKAEKFVAKMNKKLPGIIELEFRDLYEGGIFVARHGEEKGAKKRYALIDYKGNIEIRGFETVRRDWCELSKRIQRDVLTTILKERNPQKAVQMVRDVIEKLKGGKVPLEDLTIYEQITRPLAAYKAIGPHVKAAQRAMARGRPVGEGMIMNFVIIKGKGSISDRAEPAEDVKPNQYDPEYYIGHQVLPASMRVLKALGYTEEEVLEGKIQKKLEAWIKK